MQNVCYLCEMGIFLAERSVEADEDQILDQNEFINIDRMKKGYCITNLVWSNADVIKFQ